MEKFPKVRKYQPLDGENRNFIQKGKEKQEKEEGE